MSTRSTNATIWVAAAAVVSALCAGTAAGQELSVKQASVSPPSELAEPVRALVSDQATVITRGENTLEFWWVKGVPLAPTSTGTAWSDVPAGSLVGALRVATPMTDIRGFTVKPGVYTLRYALQPQDGDHTGVSPYREFLIVGPAESDTSPDPLGYKGAVALGRKTLGKSHPSALSLDPPSASGEPGAVLTNEAGHTSVVFRVPATRGGTSAGALTFGVIVIGTIKHQM